MSTPRWLRVSALDVRPEVQPRAQLDAATVARYRSLCETAGARRGGAAGLQMWPFCDASGRRAPLVAFADGGGRPVLASGFHRLAAAEQAGLSTVLVDVRSGTVDDALDYALAANARHGLPMSRADMARAIGLMLAEPRWRERTDGVIAEHLGCDRKTIAAHRARLVAEGEVPHVAERTGADGKTYSATPRVARSRTTGVRDGASRVEVVCGEYAQAPAVGCDVLADALEPGDVVICGACGERVAGEHACIDDDCDEVGGVLDVPRADGVVPPWEAALCGPAAGADDDCDAGETPDVRPPAGEGSSPPPSTAPAGGHPVEGQGDTLFDAAVAALDALADTAGGRRAVVARRAAADIRRAWGEGGTTETPRAGEA